MRPSPPVYRVAAPAQNVRETLWALVADKTGYPVEMLEPGMALEADLGIDSIKRVEIFAAVQDALPGLPELAHSDIGRLRTLDDIAVYLQAHLGNSGTRPTAQSRPSCRPLRWTSRPSCSK